MKTHKLILFFALFVVLISFGFSQNQAQIEHRVQRMKEALSLNDEQAAKITEIMKKHEVQSSQSQSKSLNKRTMMKEGRARMVAEDKEIEPLLTPEQLKKYESYKKERMNEMKSRTKGRKFKEE